MKNVIYDMRRVTVCLLSFCFVLNLQTTGQTFTTLHNFAPASGSPGVSLSTNTDGTLPTAVIASGGRLYGTTEQGGYSGYGTFFSLSSDGSTFSNLYTFPPPAGEVIEDGLGANAIAGIIMTNKLFGVADYNGEAGGGSLVFSISLDGTGFTNIHSFNFDNDGSDPRCRLIYSSNFLYGTTSEGGLGGNGTVFAIKSDGTVFSNVYNFGNDVGQPFSGLTVLSNKLYGTANGGSSENGALFSIATDGTGFTNLYNFTRGDDSSSAVGLIPSASGSILYGLSADGGIFGSGAIFAINVDGSNLTNIYNFTATSGSKSTNSDGASPSGLVLSGNTLFGTAFAGGSSGNGTVFAVKIDGTGFTVMHSFLGTTSTTYYKTNADGINPKGPIISGGYIFGFTMRGGSGGSGTIFSLTLPTPPQLAIARLGTNVVLSWPTNNSVYTLQCCTNLNSANWVTVSPSPTVVAGQNTVTNSLLPTQMFYRLR